MVSRYKKTNGMDGGYETLDRPSPPELRRFKPDFYVPMRRPVRDPNFLQKLPARPKFGMKVPAPIPSSFRSYKYGMRTLFPLIRLWDLADDLVPFEPKNGRGRYKVPKGPWVKCPYVCNNPPPASQWVNQWMKANTFYWCDPNPCLAGQGNTGTLIWSWGDDINLSVTGTTFGIWYRYELGSGVVRTKHHESWSRSGSAGATPFVRAHVGTDYAPNIDVNPASPSVAPQRMPDPNIHRWIPTLPDIEAEFHQAPPELLPPVMRRFSRVATASSGGATTGSRPGMPSPPSKGTKERKAKAIGVRLFAALDVMSEGAELVGAFYDALPQKVQKKWGCGSVKRGLIDSAGQYGIDAADCKLKALWHNWDKVDIDKALRNIIANQLQDRVIGDLMRKQPKNVGRATSEGVMEVNRLLEELFNASGLTS